MEYQIGSSGLVVSLTSSEISVNVGESAKIDVGTALNYIKSGEVEIDNYVNNAAKPAIDDYVDNTSKPAIDDYVVNTTEPNIDAYVTNTVLPQFGTYIDLAKDWATKTDGTVDGSEYSAKYYAEQAQTTLSSKQDILTADNAGTGISITGSGANVLISSTQTSAEWGNIEGNISDQTDLQNALNEKQDALTPTQMQAVNSGANTTNIGQISTNTSDIAGLQLSKQDSLIAGTDLEIVSSTDTITGTTYVSLINTKVDGLNSLTLYGDCSQTGTPSTTNPIPVLCNNGELKVNSQGEIYTDGTVETVKIRGENVWNTNDLLEGCYISGVLTSDMVESDIAFCSKLIPITDNSIYIYCSNYSSIPTSRQYTFRYALYDENETKLYVNTTARPNNVYSLPLSSYPTAKYLRVSAYYLAENFMIAFSDTAINYKPYYTGGTATAQNLLGLGEYKDTQDILSGNITRNVGIKVLKGTESWVFVPESNWSARLVLSAVPTSQTTTPSLLCNQFVSTAWRSVSSLTQQVTVIESGEYICFTTRWDSNITSLDDWKNWLATQYQNGTPVILVYPLVTPTTESVTAQNLTAKAGGNTIEITQSSISGLKLSAEFEQQDTINFTNDSGYLTSSDVVAYTANEVETLWESI